MAYEANPNNAGLACDHSVMQALNSCDELKLADALEEGGGSPGSAELDFLLSALMRDCQIELVRRLGRGQSKQGILVCEVEPRWLDRGLPECVRLQLIEGLRAGALHLRKRKVPGRVGAEPDGLWWARTRDGEQIERIMVAEGCSLKEAIYSWAEAQLGRRLQTQAELERWDKKGRREWSRLQEARRLLADVDKEIDN